MLDVVGCQVAVAASQAWSKLSSCGRELGFSRELLEGPPVDVNGDVHVLGTMRPRRSLVLKCHHVPIDVKAQVSPAS